MEAKFKGYKENEIRGHVLGYLYRSISLRLAAIIAKTPITPNQITIFRFMLFLLSAFLFVQHNVILNIFAGILLISASFGDYLDGSLARLKNMESKLGSWMDGFVDYTSPAIIFFSVALGLSFQYGNLVWLFAFLAVSAAHLVVICDSQFKSSFPDLKEDLNKEKWKRSILKNFYYSSYNIFLFITIYAFLNQLYFAIIFLAIYGWLFLLASYFILGKNLWKIGKRAN